MRNRGCVKYTPYRSEVGVYGIDLDTEVSS